MAKRNVLTIDDVAGKLCSKSITSETYVYEGIEFKLKGLTEAEYMYMVEECSKQDSEARANYLALHIACALGIDSMAVDGKPVELEKETISVIGKQLTVIPLTVIHDWELGLKQQISEKVVELTSLSNAEKKKLELFRKDR